MMFDTIRGPQPKADAIDASDGSSVRVRVALQADGCEALRV